MIALAASACGDDGNGAADAPPVAIDAPAVAQNCTTYCSQVMTNCTGANVQYSSDANCMAACAKFALTPGTAADMSGPTLGCRIYHSGTPSMTTPATHCVHAGPAGADNATAGNSVCGSACDNFCTLATAACPTQYPDLAGCKTSCGALAAGLKFTSTIQTGNTLACRLYHVTVALTTPAPHCTHIPAPTAAGACI